MGPVGSRCGRPASRGGRVRPGLAGNGEVAARARAPQARVRARRRRPPSQGGHGFSGPHHWNGFSGPRCWRRASRPAPGRTCGGRTHSPAGALAPAQGRTQPARTVLVRRENGTCSSRERYLFVVRTVLITWTGQGPGCGSQAVRFSLPVGVSASCVGVGPSSAGPRAATWGVCWLCGSGPGSGRQGQPPCRGVCW